MTKSTSEAIEAELNGLVEQSLRSFKAQSQADILGILDEVDEKLMLAADGQSSQVQALNEGVAERFQGLEERFVDFCDSFDEKLRLAADGQSSQVQAFQEGVAERFQGLEERLVDFRDAVISALPLPPPAEPPADPDELMEVRRRLRSTELEAAAFHEERRRASWYAQELARFQDANLALNQEVSALCWQINDLRSRSPAGDTLSAEGARNGLIETSWPDATWRELAVGWKNADQTGDAKPAPVDLVTPATPWEYGGFSDIISPGASRGVVRLDVIVEGASIGVLVTDKEGGSTHGTELIVAEAEEPQTVYLDLPADGSPVRIVLRNCGEGVGAARVHVDRVSLITAGDVEALAPEPPAAGEWTPFEASWTVPGGAEFAFQLPLTFDVRGEPWAFAAVTDVIEDHGESERAFELTLIPRGARLGVLAMSADQQVVLSDEVVLTGDDRPTTVRITIRSGVRTFRLICRNNDGEVPGTVTILYVRALTTPLLPPRDTDHNLAETGPRGR